MRSTDPVGERRRPLTNKPTVDNGRGLTSGPGLVNGLGYTTRGEEAERRPTVDQDDLHNQEEAAPLGLGARRDLVNGLWMPRAHSPPAGASSGGLWPPSRRRAVMMRRLRELSERPFPCGEG